MVSSESLVVLNMKTIVVIVLILVVLIWLGRMLRRREIEKFRQADVSLLNEMKQEVAGRLESDAGTSAFDAGDALSSGVIEPESSEAEFGSTLFKAAILSERQRRYLQMLEAVLTDRYRLFVNLGWSDLLKTTRPGRVSFVVCDAQYLSVEALLEFSDQLDETLHAFIENLEKPLLILSGTEDELALKQQLADLNPAWVELNARPLCPKCYGVMRLRAPESGKHAGKRFWLCQSYPNCRGTQSA